MYNILHPHDHELLNRQFVTDSDVELQSEGVVFIIHITPKVHLSTDVITS